MERGLSDGEAARKVVLFSRALDALRQLADPDVGTVMRFWVPGRIELLGKHTDYAGGRSLLCAIERGFCVVALPRIDRRVRICDARTGELVDGAVDAASSGTPGHWGAYPLTVARRIAQNFESPLVGADIAFASDLPVAAGISSSSALVVATFLVLAEANALRVRGAFRSAIPTADAQAEYLGAVENGLSYGSLHGDRGVGTFGGSEDHTAILSAQPNAIVQYSFCPVRREATIPLPGDQTFVIASSGVVAEKTGAALESYNRVASLAQAALARWNLAARRADRSLGAAVAASGYDADALIDLMTSRRTGVEKDGFDDADIAERVRQFVVESETLIPAAAEALVAARLDDLGAIVDRSMRNAVELLHNQIPETEFLAARARELGASAASAFGAGFGGSVWALVDRAAGAGIAAQLLADYRERFPQHADRAESFVTGASGAAGRV